MEGYKWTGYRDQDRNKLFDGHTIEFDINSMNRDEGRTQDVIVFSGGDYFLMKYGAPLRHIVGSFDSISMRMQFNYRVKLIKT